MTDSAHVGAFNPERLTQARRRRGWTKVQLAEAVGVTPQSIANYEKGRQTPSDLPAVAEALDFPVAFFSRPTPESVEPSHATFRALSAMTARQRDAVLAAAELGVEFERTCMRHRFYLPPPAVPHLGDQVGQNDPETAAAMVRAEWGLGNQPIANMIHLLEAKGVRVYTLDGEDRRVGAFCIWRHDTPFVFLNMAQSAERVRFDAAHELGHLVMHRSGPADAARRDPDQEREANHFAGAFLMPEMVVRAVAPRLATADDMRRLKIRWGVAVMALAYRLKQLGLLRGPRHERRLFATISGRGWRRDEPDPIRAETSSIYQQIIDALRERGITLQALARDLGVYTDDLAGLIFGVSAAPEPERRAFVPRLIAGGRG